MAGLETTTTVTLMSGEVVLIEAYNLALALELRGVILREDAGDIIYHPRRAVKPAERVAIARLKPDLLRIIRYCAWAM